MIEKKKFIKFRAKPFINKTTNQVSFAIPKRKIKKIDPTLKFSNDMFIELRILRGKNGN